MSYEQTTAFLQAQAKDALNQASNNAARIYSLPPPAVLRDPRFDVDLTKPILEAPPQLSDLFTEGDSTQTNLMWLDQQADAWIAKYFPEINGCLKTQPEETLCAIISGSRPFGVDKTVFEQVWNQARDRAYRGADSETKTLRATYSARGFTLPVGAMVDLAAQAERRASDVVLDVNRHVQLADNVFGRQLTSTLERNLVRLANTQRKLHRRDAALLGTVDPHIAATVRKRFDAQVFHVSTSGRT